MCRWNAADTREVSLVFYRSHRITRFLHETQSRRSLAHPRLTGAVCQSKLDAEGISVPIAVPVACVNKGRKLRSRILHGFRFRGLRVDSGVSKTHSNTFFQQFILNLVLQDKASSKALIVRVHLGFVCCTCVRSVTRVTECICEQHCVYIKRSPGGRELQYTFIIDIFFSPPACHHHDSPTLTQEEPCTSFTEKRRTRNIKIRESIEELARFLELELESRHAFPKVRGQCGQFT